MSDKELLYQLSMTVLSSFSIFKEDIVKQATHGCSLDIEVYSAEVLVIELGNFYS